MSEIGELDENQLYYDQETLQSSPSSLFSAAHATTTTTTTTTTGTPYQTGAVPVDSTVAVPSRGGGWSSHAHRRFATVADYVRELAGDQPCVIEKILIANNGVAAVKAIRSIRKWAYEVLGDERAIQFVVMATPEDLRCVCVLVEVLACYCLAVEVGPLLTSILYYTLLYTILSN